MDFISTETVLAVAIGILVIAIAQKVFAPATPAPTPTPPVEEKPVVAPRYFTPAELRAFNGEDGAPIYVAIKGEIYDVSSKADFYGPGAGYHLFAGREAARALAKMSFEAKDLDNTDVSDLNFMENEVLNDWIVKFRDFNSYPVVGRLLDQRDLTRAELAKYTKQPIYVAIKGTIYDVTLGGREHYGPNGGYKLFAGQDASRALALMSFDAANLETPTLDDLTDTQRKTLDDWEAKFKSKYGVVGKLLD
ncbi:heme/steroid binding domain-containing protein [Achlya hypogyna]|uniref:Heme/steroid binding domain-containing protein n=1 Tax=Achlya hypogyna TaxID=1202772 RepID=A0A1V9ZTF4_ACHHY|nr:heme/steroid binding domain-containing protein [Achlya hypogyna]